MEDQVHYSYITVTSRIYNSELSSLINCVRITQMNALICCHTETLKTVLNSLFWGRNLLSKYIKFTSTIHIARKVSISTSNDSHRVMLPLIINEIIIKMLQFFKTFWAYPKIPLRKKPLGNSNAVSRSHPHVRTW